MSDQGRASFVTNRCADLYLDLLKRSLMGTLDDQGSWSIKRGRTPLRRWLINLLRKRSIMLVSNRGYDPKQRQDGEDWPLTSYTMAGAHRLDNIRRCIETVLAENIEGDFMECGVWRGGSSIFARGVFQAYGAIDRKVWLADSFEGMPAITSDADTVDPDHSDIGYLAVSLEQVRQNFQTFNLFDDNVRFIKGWFSDTLAHAAVERLSILRLDGDHYSSTMDALTALYDKVSPGGFIIIDDYHGFQGCKNAVNEYRSQRSVRNELIPIDNIAVYWRR
jgi:hypothetical protein